MKQLSIIRNALAQNNNAEERFLTVIDVNGNIESINNHMQRVFKLHKDQKFALNFFDLIHPEHLGAFQSALTSSRQSNCSASTELHLKNGYYHPMKWNITYLGQVPDSSHDKFFCVGVKTCNEDRLQQFIGMGENSYQQIVENVSAGILFQDSRGNIIAANKKAAEIFQTNLETLYSIPDVQAAWDSWGIKNEHGEPLKYDEAPAIIAVRTSQPASAIIVLKVSTGEEKWLLFNSQPFISAKEHDPVSVITNIVDITREKSLALEVEERDALLQSFLYRTPNLAWVVDEESKLVFASRSFFEYFQIKEDESIGKAIFELVPQVVADSLYGKHIHVLETGLPIETVEKAKWHDGRNFIFHINLFPIEGARRKKLLGGHAVNIADKYAVEKRLREVNDRLLLLSRATSDAIWEWDMQTGNIFRNDALMDMVGYQIESTKGLSWWLRRIHPEDRNRITDTIKEATDNGKQSWSDQYRFKFADGSYHHIQDKGYVVYENGLPIKMIGSLHDITDLKKLEDQLTAEKLQRQKEISETVIRVQEKERTRIGHELHDNVNQILGTAKLFMDMVKPFSEEDGNLKAKSIEYVLSAIEEIRKLSKELVVPQLKQKGLIDSICGVIQDIHASSSLQIKFTHDQEADLLSPGKQVTIFRIIQEQLKNILKYSQATKAEILLQEKDGNIELVVMDHGIGFDPKKSSNGIGLSNIHDRARFYNGVVDIESAPGKGCKLSVSLPVID